MANVKPLLEQDILEANENTGSAAAAARYLRVSYNTYKKYAKMYGLFEEQKNQAGVGISKAYNLHSGRYALDDILEGKYPGYDKFRLKQRIIYSGYMEEKCSHCGLDERRVSDDKVPLILHHKNDDDTDHRYENLEFLCYNCYFYLVGNIKGPKKHLIY